MRYFYSDRLIPKTKGWEFKLNEITFILKDEKSNQLPRRFNKNEIIYYNLGNGVVFL